MYAVGRLGSYITRGVYTVSGPFHPFGGAVDIVVVQQQDGSLKSSPWYVRFGKFQGVLKAKERVVDINVNGVDADFHMYLDPRGEAYFLREVDAEEAADGVSPPSFSGEETNGKIPVKSKSMNYDFDRCEQVIDVGNGQVLSRNNSKRSRILGFVLGRTSMKEHSLSKEENERAEIAADLLEMKWSTNLSSKSNKKDRRESSNDNGEITGGRLESSLVLHEQHFVNNMDGRVVENEVQETIVADVNGVNEENTGLVETCVFKEESSRILSNDPNEPNESLEVTESCTEVVSNQEGEVCLEVASCSSVSVPICETTEDEHSRKVDKTSEIRSNLESNGEFQDVSGDSILTKEIAESYVEEQFVFGDLDDLKTSTNNTGQETRSPSSEVDPNPPPIRLHQERFKGKIEGPKRNIRRYLSYLDIPRSCEITEEEVQRQSKSLPNMWSQFGNSDQEIHDESPFYSPVGKFRSSKWDIIRDDASRIIKTNIEKEFQFSDPQSADNLSKDRKDGCITGGGPPDIVNGTGGSWSLWPFRRLGSKSIPQKEEECKKDSDADSGVEVDEEKEESSPQSNKMHTRSLTPTPEQLASLNLAEGQNTVTFTFSTSVLGSQKVDARIYLWRWDTRIVISDVDGTITKSDVLGQFMPLVGRDWSHLGVTHLFSAIKENGYQMLYLSARAISQASITRQFLFNLKQDGKALPDGPVVISPDGLFPSLFREVIRRAPHEFKIACLEDIKSCFPSDRNPFYAGFGNRDTDEFSYLKVGIPKGKIFIINPKGEVVVNRCINSKSYTSLHALVNGIFPPISVHEEEDYNSWNFWKLPPPTID